MKIRYQQNLIRLFFIAYMFAIYFISYRYQLMLLNGLLAYIPIELSFWLTNKKLKSTSLFFIISAVWLVFFPNLPYLLTDLVHLSWLRPYIPDSYALLSAPNIWKDFYLLLAGVIGFLIVGYHSLKAFGDTLAIRFNFKKNYYVHLFYLFICGISSFGIYLGRFSRLHTVYLITDPIESIRAIIDAFEPNMYLFILGFTILQLILFYAVSFIRLDNTSFKA
ncbi:MULTISPECIES: DUF1361 domain-containing protein [Carnobacterium]|uniref:DUF1361 domain-containing protein n=1 Tax=Carnobacterium TaxID=2747 RepID=UPI00191BCA59|nr:DUF1361 domain-containing protein [Carnobacterium maltaromaticum]MCC4312450.1 hypothetical protein [Carnobacterium maltaromaticum]CAD5900805.1 conserved membrane hypothetical protein [Carnobacterium maltaromaticum]